METEEGTLQEDMIAAGVAIHGGCSEQESVERDDQLWQPMIEEDKSKKKLLCFSILLSASVALLTVAN